MVALLAWPGEVLPLHSTPIPGPWSVASGSDARLWPPACATRPGVAHSRYPNRSARSSSQDLVADDAIGGETGVGAARADRWLSTLYAISERLRLASQLERQRVGIPTEPA